MGSVVVDLVTKAEFADVKDCLCVDVWRFGDCDTDMLYCSDLVFAGCAV